MYSTIYVKRVLKSYFGYHQWIRGYGLSSESGVTEIPSTKTYCGVVFFPTVGRKNIDRNHNKPLTSVIYRHFFFRE